MRLLKWWCLFSLLLCAACLSPRHSESPVATFDLHAPDLTPLTSVRTLSSTPIRLTAADLPRLPIYVENETPSFAAACFLASTLEQMLGVRPEIIRAFSSLTNSTPGFYIGAASPLAATHSPTSHPEAFRVLASPTDTSFHFLGRGDFAVYDFCERLLGVRIYSDDPAANATFIPHLTNALILPRIDYTDQPIFNYRVLGSDYMKHDFARLAKVGSSHRGLVHVHQPSRWAADTNLVARLPILFALTPDGTRAASPLLCYSNPLTLAYYRQRIDEHIAGTRDSGGIVDTARKTITISPWDTTVACACPTCRAVLDESLGLDASASNLLWSHFATRLATWMRLAHPDYLVCILPYINTCAVPHGLDFTALNNVEATVCTMNGLALFKNPATRIYEENLIESWARTTGRKVLNWHYICWPAEFTDAPYLFAPIIIDHLKRMQPFSDGTFICSSSDRVRFSLDTYVWLRGLWNPNTNADAIYDAFCHHMFGPAANPMRRLLNLQLQGWLRPWPTNSFLDENLFGISYPSETIHQMRDLFSQAWQKTTADENARKRLLWYAKGFTRFFLQADHFENGVHPQPLNFTHITAEDLPRIDGLLSEPIWQKTPARNFVHWNDDLTNAPTAQTSVQTLVSSNGLYFAFTCFAPPNDLASLKANAPIVEDHSRETIKLVFDPTGTNTGRCYQIVLDYGARIQASCDGLTIKDIGMRCATSKTSTAWTLEFFLPRDYLIPNITPKGNLIRWHISADGSTEWTRLVTRGICRDLDRNAFTEFRIP